MFGYFRPPGRQNRIRHHFLTPRNRFPARSVQKTSVSWRFWLFSLLFHFFGPIPFWEAPWVFFYTTKYFKLLNLFFTWSASKKQCPRFNFHPNLIVERVIYGVPPPLAPFYIFTDFCLSGRRSYKLFHHVLRLEACRRRLFFGAIKMFLWKKGNLSCVGGLPQASLSPKTRFWWKVYIL